jgi:hypothetical protein
VIAYLPQVARAIECQSCESCTIDHRTSPIIEPYPPRPVNLPEDEQRGWTGLGMGEKRESLKGINPIVCYNTRHELVPYTLYALPLIAFV